MPKDKKNCSGEVAPAVKEGAKKGSTASTAPEVVVYKTPFTFSGETHEEAGRIYRLPNKADCFAFRTFADSLDGFTLRYSRPYEVMVWDRKLPNEPMHVIKVFGIFRKTKENPQGGCTPKELYDMLQDPIFRGEWDDYRKEAFRVVSLSPSTDIGYYAARSPVPLVANRDFVNQRMWHEAGHDEYVIFNTSVPHANVPPSYQKDTNKNKHGEFVRAISKLTGYLIRPWKNPETGAVEGTSLTYITQTDPCGWIPTTITNYIATKFAPNTIHNVDKAIPLFREWFKKQLEEGTYNKDWDMTPEWWVTEGDGSSTEVKNETIDFAAKHWKEEKDKKSKKK
jgi:StAR-related lipid transfer protein 10